MVTECIHVLYYVNSIHLNGWNLITPPTLGRPMHAEKMAAKNKYSYRKNDYSLLDQVPEDLVYPTVFVQTTVHVC